MYPKNVAQCLPTVDESVFNGTHLVADIPDAVSVSENEHGLTKVTLTHASGTTAEVGLGI